MVVPVMSGVEMTVPAEEVEEGDFLTGLDNGYVFEEPERNPNIGYGRWNTALGEGAVLISFHDAQGDENYLICAPDMKVSVRR